MARPRRNERLETGKLWNKLMKAANDTYADHERSTSDPYLKRRINNAVNQVVRRAALELWPEFSAELGVKVEPWAVSMDDVRRVEAVTNPARTDR